MNQIMLLNIDVYRCFTSCQVEIFDPRVKTLDIKRLRCKLKDLFFPYIKVICLPFVTFIIYRKRVMSNMNDSYTNAYVNFFFFLVIVPTSKPIWFLFSYNCFNYTMGQMFLLIDMIKFFSCTIIFAK